MPLTFDSAIDITAPAVLAAIAIFLLRKVESVTRFLLAAGVVCIAVAAGGPRARWTRPPGVLVMLDQSASTRLAAYHDPAWMNARLQQLLPNASVSIVNFSDPSEPVTQWNPPAAEALLLFSDGQFEPPSRTPPTWAVIDPALQQARDSAIESVTTSENGSAVAFIRNSGESRIATCGIATVAVPTGGGGFVFAPSSTAHEVRLNPADAWPENDELPLSTPDNARRQRWWVGEAPPPPGWLSVAVPSALEPFAAAGVITIDHSVSLSPAQQNALRQYVGALGGGLILIDQHVPPNAGWDDLSPLSVDPPTPARRWIILLDSSGSMSQRDGVATRLAAAQAAARAMISELPINDAVAVGTFARDLKWWLSNATIAEARRTSLFPETLEPSGPTNLEPLLHELLRQRAVDLATTLIVITDSDATLQDADSLQAALSAQRVSLNVLSIDAANRAFARLCAATGGKVIAATELSTLNDQAHELVQAARPATARSTTLAFLNELHLPSRTQVATAPAWLREHATALTAIDDECITAAAEWHRGSGRVAALSFAPTAAELEAVADRVARQPADPRILLSLESRQLSIDAGALPDCNRRNFTLTIETAAPIHFEQIAPGRYRAAIDPSAAARSAVVRLDGEIIQSMVIPAHYAPEFDAIGVNAANLRQIATRSDGGVIEPDDTAPITLPRIRREVALRAPLASLGAACVLLAALRRKL